MKFKKPTIIICAAAVLVCAAVAVFFLTNPIGKEEEPQNEDPSPKILSPEEYPEDIDDRIWEIVALQRGNSSKRKVAEVHDILVVEEVSTINDEKEILMYAVASFRVIEKNLEHARFFEELSQFDNATIKLNSVEMEFDTNGKLNTEKIFAHDEYGKLVEDYFTKTSAFEIKLIYDGDKCIKVDYWESNNFPDEVKERYSKNINWDVRSYFEDHNEKMRKKSIDAVLDIYDIYLYFEDEHTYGKYDTEVLYEKIKFFFDPITFSGMIIDQYAIYYFTTQYNDGTLCLKIYEKYVNGNGDKVDYTLLFKSEGRSLIFVDDDSDNILENIKDGDKFILRGFSKY